MPTADTPWPKEKSERASINSFGIGGVNAHVILESAASHGIDQSLEPICTEEPQLLLYSSNDQRSTAEVIRQHEEYADIHPELIKDHASTLAHRRNEKPYRAFSVRIDGASAQVSPALKSKQTPRVTLIFTGQGAQWAQMGIDLLSRFPSFERDIDAMQQTLMRCPHPPAWSILGRYSDLLHI